MSPGIRYPSEFARYQGQDAVDMAATAKGVVLTGRPCHVPDPSREPHSRP